MTTTEQPMLIQSEAAYDLIRDHLDLILELQSKPLPVHEVYVRMKQPNMLPRMLQYGILKQDHHHITVGSGVIQQYRQENMTTFLDTYVAPVIRAHLSHAPHTHTRWLSLHLSDYDIQQLRTGPVQSCLNTLTHYSESTLTGPTARLSVGFVGATMLRTDDPWHMQCHALLIAACEQRMSQKTGILTQFDCLADTHRYNHTIQHVQSLCDALDSKWKNDDLHNFHMLVTTHWHNPCEH